LQSPEGWNIKHKILDVLNDYPYLEVMEDEPMFVALDMIPDYSDFTNKLRVMVSGIVN